MSSLAVRATGISRHYAERAALDGFSIEVPVGSVFGLLGPNGSGKSTFLALLAAMDAPESGSLEVFGQAPSRALRARTGAVFQENAADPLMRVSEYLRFAGRLFGVPGSELAPRIEGLLGRFGLAERAREPVSTLSGGMRRRLEVARALLHQPDLVLLDEPTTGVDADERGVLWSALRESSPGTTILLATNDLGEADAVCDQVAFVKDGRVVAAGTPAQLKAGLRAESVHITWDSATAEQLAVVASWPGTGEVARDGGTVVASTDDAARFVPRLFELAAGQITAVSIAAASLEDAYFHHVARRSEGPAK